MSAPHDCSNAHARSGSEPDPTFEKKRKKVVEIMVEEAQGKNIYIPLESTS
jgi:hypothetical protein